MSKDFNRAVVFVTGPAAGIGQELAHLLAKHRSQLISVDQNAEGLRAQHGVPRSSPRPWPRWGAAQAVYQAVQAEGLQVDILVNDAGFGE